MSVCPSVHMERFGLHCTDFCVIIYWEFLLKSVNKVQVCLKSDKNNRNFSWRYNVHLCHWYLEWRLFSLWVTSWGRRNTDDLHLTPGRGCVLCEVQTVAEEMAKDLSKAIVRDRIYIGWTEQKDCCQQTEKVFGDVNCAPVLSSAYIS
jgi:hypothetical protein